jgi:hypothetical protein
MRPESGPSAQHGFSGSAALSARGHQVLVRRSVQYHLTDYFNE